jgi:multidrug efflux pump subunit AcrB
MWLLRVALRRPYTFLVMALMIAIGGVYSIAETPTDIFPNIDIPVISVIFRYGGLPPEQMEKRVVNNFERFSRRSSATSIISRACRSPARRS